MKPFFRSRCSTAAIFCRSLFSLIAIALATTCYAQTDAPSLEAALKNKQMRLRNYSADRVAQYEWTGTSLVTKSVSLHALSVFITKSVRLKKNKLVIEGDRAIMVRDAKNNSVMIDGKAAMTLEISLNDSDPATVIPDLPSLVFFPDVKSAVLARPESVADLLPFDISDIKHPERPKSIFENGKWVLAPKDAKIVNPQILSASEPGMTDAARQAKVNGAVWLVFSVSETGQVGDVWLARPLGYGLDEEAAKTVRKYVFKPEQCDGRPVGTVLQTEVMFQIQ